LTAAAVAQLTNLALATGNVGREGAGVNPLVSDSNSMGANDMGCQPGMFPGYRPVNADNARELEELWSLDPDRASQEVPSEPGLSLASMIDAIESGDIKALWVVGSNPVLGSDNADSARVEAALAKLEFLVVQDIFFSETAQHAHIILPATSYAEKEGTYTNTERRVQRVRAAIQPVGACKTDLQIINLLGHRLGVILPSMQPNLVFAEIAKVVPQYAGMSYARLDMTEFINDEIAMPAAVSLKQLKVRSLMWPCGSKTHPGTPVLYTEGFGTASGKARMWVPSGQGSTPEESAGGALMATFGFPLFPFKSGTLSRQSYGLSRVEPDPRLHLNSADAVRLGITDQTPVEISFPGSAGSEPAYAISQVYDRVPQGTAFLAMTLEQAGTNAAVRAAKYSIAADGTGTKKAVPIMVKAAPHIKLDELAPMGAGMLTAGE
jgi:predicted molibdopterin-dependent oxidoreductase YjgC